MKYECYGRYVSDSRSLHRVGEVITEEQYNVLPDKEKKHYREHKEPFWDEFEENRIEDDKKDNED